MNVTFPSWLSAYFFLFGPHHEEHIILDPYSEPRMRKAPGLSTCNFQYFQECTRTSPSTLHSLWFFTFSDSIYVWDGREKAYGEEINGHAFTFCHVPAPYDFTAYQLLTADKYG